MDLLVNIDVPDLGRAVAFYTEAFGLTVSPESRLAKRTRTVTVRPGLDLARRRVPILSAR